MPNAERSPAEEARLVAEAYAAETRPPLTDSLRQDLAARLARAWPEGVGAVNAALDAFEESLDAVAGPRLAAFDAGSGRVTMEQRSEAGRPLRAFGGQ
ncbi:conserved hypothetical protein [Methylobacterium sp. 4-46]|uniref:hypothetical protein n=1 Tax=unclassified Methylobacterium TaxID=2615210 RepID=UPI000165C5A6|nr:MULTISPECIES: hypothetical protein [Methylobacterium]ACA17673.1 conserved hypothetical protein [Methylobacterium sp. 4-46]WFT83342.1 hypothetical protein QA634_16565 [Methylobacterium nodulans]